MPNDDKKIAQLLRVYREMDAEERRIAYELIRSHQAELVIERKSQILIEGMTKYGAFMGPSSGGCPRCGYPN
jgi:hypothetical protein